VVEQLTENQRVASSILARGTKRVSYNGYYMTLPMSKRGFNSLHPLKRSEKTYLFARSFLGLTSPCG
jgi:hypothetical protein